MWIRSFIRQFSIRLRMLGAIGVVLALLLAVGSVGVWGMQRQQALNQEFFEHAFQETVALSNLRLALADLSRYEKEMVIQYESPEQLSLAHMKWTNTRDGMGKLIASMLQGEADEDNVILQTMVVKLQDYSLAVEPIVTNIKVNGYDSATMANRMLARAHERYADLLVDMKKIETIVGQEAASVQDEQMATAQKTMALFGVAVLFAVFVVVPTTLANMQSICRPLDQAQKVALAITQGDLTRPVRVEGKDELSRLMSALGDMQASLSRIVGEVRASTEHINVSSTEIAAGNQDLSLRTERAAGSLQQTASSVEQINGMVRQSTEAARQASDMARANAEVATRGGAVVQQVVDTMEGIRHSSQKIRDIIGTIDGIAFQTNILALNAAVEAARAGEQGRGFAVVAGEVRRLAQRSAEAAQEIKTLISDSVGKVETGSAQVSEAGSTIGEIVQHAQQIAALIQHITTAATEQSQGIEQVNGAIGGLEQVTQQNAALVEESAAAAQSLQEQARKLAGLVARFQLA